MSHITQGVGGSLLSIGSLEKRKNGLKKFAKSFGSKVHITGKKKDKYSDDDSIASGSTGYISGGKYSSGPLDNFEAKQQKNVDPGVISEDEDEFTFDDLSQISSTSSVCSPNLSSGVHSIKSSEQSNLTAQQQAPVTANIAGANEWEAKLYGKHVQQYRSQLTQSQELANKNNSNSNVSVTESVISEPSTASKPSPKLEKVLRNEPKQIRTDNKKEKDKDANKLSKKFKYFRKGKKFS